MLNSFFVLSPGITALHNYAFTFSWLNPATDRGHQFVGLAAVEIWVDWLCVASCSSHSFPPVVTTNLSRSCGSQTMLTQIHDLPVEMLSKIFQLIGDTHREKIVYINLLIPRVRRLDTADAEGTLVEHRPR